MRNTSLAYLPLNELQAVKLNALSVRRRGQRSELVKILSPRQMAMMGQISSALSETPRLLAGLSFPEDQSELAAYNDELLDRLEMSSK